MTSDLVFDGRIGRYPEGGSVEWIVLQACADRRAWRQLRALDRGEFENAIEQLRPMGWGFQWSVIH